MARTQIEDVVSAKQNVTPQELDLVAKIYNFTKRIQNTEQYTRKRKSLEVSRSNYRRKLRSLQTTGEQRTHQEIRDDISVVKFHIFVTQNEIEKVEQQLADAMVTGRAQDGHSLYLHELYSTKGRLGKELEKLQQEIPHKTRWVHTSKGT